jgi:hypothetical protein
VLLLALLAGCSSKPSAPPLQDGPVYKNEREGFRFFTPEGWKQVARGEVPPGKVVGERMLVEYKCLTCATTGSLEVTVAEISPSDSLADYVAKNTLTGESWRQSGPVEDFKINGEPAVRLKYVLPAGTHEMVREIVAFRRGERVYFFKGFYASADTKSRKEIRTAVDSIVW